MKSHTNSNQKHGLGRSNRKIKELYAQIFYTLYEIKTNIRHYDILGIGIPNDVSPKVLDSMSYIANDHGLGFLSATKGEWVALIRSARSKISQA